MRMQTSYRFCWKISDISLLEEKNKALDNSWVTTQSLWQYKTSYKIYKFMIRCMFEEKVSWLGWKCCSSTTEWAWRWKSLVMCKPSLVSQVSSILYSRMCGLVSYQTKKPVEQLETRKVVFLDSCPQVAIVGQTCWSFNIMALEALFSSLGSAYLCIATMQD